MRILLVSHELTVTGAPASLLRQAGYFLEAGHAVDVWSLAGGPLAARYEEAGIVPRIVRDDRRSLKTAYESAGKPYDFFLCNTTRTYRAVDVLRRYGIPIVWFIRETKLLDEDIWLNPDFERVFRGFDNLYTVSEYAAGVVRRYNPNVRVINNAVADRFRDFGPVSAGLRIGYIGSYTEQKGVSVLVEAFRRILVSHPDARLVLAGDVGHPDCLARLKAETAGEDRIVWLGEVQGEAKAAFFESINVLCVPSYDEPSGLTVIEGAMYGKPVVTTDETGANYIVDSSSGRIVRAGDPAALAAALAELAEADFAAMGAAARRRYLELGSVERERRDVLRMLEDNRNRVPQVSGRLRFDDAWRAVRIRRNRRGTVRLYLLGVKILQWRGKGIRGKREQT